MSAVRYTEAPARREELARRLRAEGYLGSATVARDLGVSEMTIRRDLRQLELDGLARRVVGGARLADGAGIPFEERTRTGAWQKRSIAARAVEVLGAASTVALDAGTTVAPLGALLPAGTTVVTHSVPAITACAGRDDLELISLGGVYQTETRAFAGPTTRAGLEALSVDVAVLSTTAIDDVGVLCASVLDAEIKRGMSAIARRTVLLADSSKFRARASIRFGALSMIDTLVTDAEVTDEELERMRAAGIEVVVASAEAGRVVS